MYALLSYEVVTLDVGHYMNMHADEYAERRVMRETGSMRARACNYGVLERRPALD